MRIALVSQEYPPETAKGGLGTQTFAKAHGLARRGHEVFVISRSPDGRRREYRDGPVQVQRVPGFERRLPLYSEVAEWLTYSAEVATAIAARHTATPLDLVDFPEWAAEGYTHLLNQSEWNRIPSVIHLHGPLALFAHEMGWPSLDSEFYRTGTAMEGTCLRLADAIFSSSRYSASIAAQHYPVSDVEIPVIHTGVDTKFFAPKAAPKAARPTIVFAGKLVPNKGVFALVDAAMELAAELPDLQVRLLGRADENVARELRRRASSTGRGELLDFAGFIPRQKLPEQLSTSHVFAAPAPHEPGPGLVYLEAMACGLPAIACAGSGAAEVVRHEETGLLIPPNDHAALVNALRWLLTNDVTRAAMGRQARQHMVEHFDTKVCLETLEQFYAAVIARVKARA